MVNNVSSLSPVWNAATAGRSKDSPAKIKDTAQQFEGLMIGELLKTAREAGSASGWTGTSEEDQAGQTGLDMAEQQLATVMAKSGGFGLTKFIVHSLERKS